MKFPQLSLRDLFWLVLVCAMGCAWWVDRSRLEADRTRLSDLLDFAIKKNEVLNASEETMRHLYAETEPSADNP
jgi:hypothetical protein